MGAPGGGRCLDVGGQREKGALLLDSGILYAGGFLYPVLIPDWPHALSFPQKEAYIA